MNPNNPYTILAIDTSCDETSVAVTRGTQVLSNALFSQIAQHQQFGGVVPSLAKLAHQERIDGVIKEALHAAKLTLAEISAIAVTKGPGLAIALEVGINKAKELAKSINIPLFGINHMEGHLLSVLAEVEDINKVKFPALALLVSGGHAEMVLVKNVGNYQIIGETLDDAVGEAYDKCGRMMGLSYPAGPKISQLAEQYRGKVEVKTIKQNQKLYVQGLVHGEVKYELPIAMAFSDNLDVSYSGLKTAFKQMLNNLGYQIPDYTPGRPLQPIASETELAELCVIFEAAALGILTLKLRKAISEFSPNELWIGGGVAASTRLQYLTKQSADEFGLTPRIPNSRELMVDNAAMIGIAAGFKIQSNSQGDDPDILDRDPILKLS